MIAVMGVSFTACNNATTQGQLQNILNDHNHESFEYAVSAQDKDGNPVAGYDGSYTVTLDKYTQGSTVTDFGSATLSDVKEGILVKGHLSVGTTEYFTGSYFSIISGSSYMVPAYSFRTIKKDGNVTFSLNAAYDGKSSTTLAPLTAKNRAALWILVKWSTTTTTTNSTKLCARSQLSRSPWLSHFQCPSSAQPRQAPCP